MPARSSSGYQPLNQSIDEEEDVGDAIQAPQSRPTAGTRGRRRGSIDLTKLDTAFKRLGGLVLIMFILLKGRQMDRIYSTESEAEEEGHRLFQKADLAKRLRAHCHCSSGSCRRCEWNSCKTMPRLIMLSGQDPRRQASYDASGFRYVSRFLTVRVLQLTRIRLIQAVRSAIAEGIHPKMITKGSSGSYFARANTEGRVHTVACVSTSHRAPPLSNSLSEYSSRRMRSLMGGLTRRCAL